MENKKLFVGIILTSLLLLGVVPYFKVSAQSCDADALRSVSYGQRSAAVKNVQACLSEAGYLESRYITGYYGPKTRAAVKAFYADWYGSWHGNNFGPRGVQELRNLVAGGVPPRDETPRDETPRDETQPTTGVPNEVLMQALTLMLGGKTNEAMALLAPYLGGIQLPVSTPTAPTTTTSPPTTELVPGEEGFLTVERDPSVGIVTLREGETGRVAGIRLRADNGAVSVKSLFLRWTSGAAPHRVISNLVLKDSAGNVLYQTAVNNTTFLQDSSLNYYLPISGLNVYVPKNNYASVFVEVSVVGTLPSGVTSMSLAVGANDVRGVDGAGVNRFAPSTGLTWTPNLQQSLAGNAYFIGALNTQSPRESYVAAEDVTRGTRSQARVLTFDLTSKNDNLRLTQVSGSVTVGGGMAISHVTAVYLRQGNTILDSQTPNQNTGAFTFNVVPSNFVVNKDQTVNFDILVDLSNAVTSSVGTFTVSVGNVTGLNSLGSSVTSNLNLSSNMMRWVSIAPQFTVANKLVSVVKDQNNATTTVSNAEFSVKIKALNGSIYVANANAATITIETVAGQSQNVNVNVSEVRDESGNSITPVGGFYSIPENREYTFVFRTSGQQFAGIHSVRARLLRIVWDVNDTGAYPLDSANFLGDNPDFRTSYVAP